MRTTLSLLALATLATGCSNLREQFFLTQSDAPFVYDVGELVPITYEELLAAQADPAASDKIHFGRLGAGEDPGVFGGATVQFRGTGGPVCVMVDPEALFWNRQLQSGVVYKYADVYEDDGDIDLSVGLTAYYTGSPGEEIGDFEATFTDAAGMPHQLEFNECEQFGYFGDPAHAGRATVEYCGIDTSLREGVMYTALLETFSLPIDDNVLSFGVLIYDGPCQDSGGRDGIPWINDEGEVTTGPSECVLTNEVGNSSPDGLPDDKAWFPELESYLCAGTGKVNSYCKDNPGEGCQEPDQYTQE